MSARRILMALLLLAPCPALPATLRPMTTLDGGMVRLSDLFDDAGSNAARELGPAPAPGARIVVEAPQLDFIARHYGVDWRPASGAERAIIERRGEAMQRAPVEERLRQALREAGVDPDAALEMTGFALPLLPVGAAPEITIVQLDLDAPTGRFTALASIEAEGMERATIRISGRAVPTVAAAVTTRRVEAGDMLRPGDLKAARVPARLGQDGIVTAPEAAIGMTVRHALPPDAPVPLAALYRPPLVAKRAVVMVELSTPGMTLTTTGEALEAGALGEHVRILNTSSKAVIEAEVIGDSHVRALPGTLPVVPPGGRNPAEAAP